MFEVAGNSAHIGGAAYNTDSIQKRETKLNCDQVFYLRTNTFARSLSLSSLWTGTGNVFGRVCVCMSLQIELHFILDYTIARQYASDVVVHTKAMYHYY